MTLASLQGVSPLFAVLSGSRVVGGVHHQLGDQRTAA